MNHIAILLPVYNDWECVQNLLSDIDVSLSKSDTFVDVWIVNDGSTKQPYSYQPISFTTIQNINLIQLVRNLGHQRSISIGLSYLSQNYKYEAVIVMDSDGEDLPIDILRLIDSWKQHPNDIIFAKRGRRHESIVFILFYRFFQLLFRILTGQNIQNGNFCLIPKIRLDQIVTMPEIWNNFSVGCQKTNIPRIYVLCDRGKRYTGHSKMNFTSLIIHGLSSISVFSEIIGVRGFIWSLSLIAALIAASIIVIYVRLFTILSIPGWATTTLGLLLILISQIFVLTLIFSILILNQRSIMGFIPIRDYSVFISEIRDYNSLPLFENIKQYE